jgi:hypothetical protein
MRPITGAARQKNSTQLPPPSPERVVPADVTELVRGVFRTWVAGAAEDIQLRRALRLFCDVAQQRQLRPEEVLVALKGMFRSVPEVRDTRNRDISDNFIGRAVTMCIEEYYAMPVDRRQPDASDVTAK